MAGILKITDGTTEIVLTSSARPAAASGLHRATLDQGWLPQIAEYKGGGIWQDSPLSDNRTLATTQFQNVVESFQLNLRDAATSLYPTGLTGPSAQDLMIRTLQEIRRLLEKAAAYWTTSWQDEPVYLVAQSEYETNARYAILYRGSVPEDKDPYFQLFERVGDPMMLGLTCIVERGHWTANIPGTGTCVKANSQQVYDTYPWEISTAAPTVELTAIIQTSTGTILASEGTAAANDRVWRSVNDGVVWGIVVVDALNANGVWTFLQTTTGKILLGGTNIIFDSIDDGATWNQTARAGAGAIWALLQLPSGRILAAETIRVEYSDDDGVTWNVIAGSPINIHSLLQTTSGKILGGGVNEIWASVDGGLVWSQVKTFTLTTVADLFQSTTGRIFAPLTNSQIWVSDDDGVTWFLISTVTGAARGLFQRASDGAILAGDTGMVIYSIDDGVTWHTLTALPAGAVYSMLQSTTTKIFAGEVGQIWEHFPFPITFGAEESCNDIVFIANKHNVANLTHVFIDDGGIFSANLLPMTTLPVSLLPTVPALNDIIYFGIHNTPEDSGPFCSLVFDLLDTIIFDNAYTITWQYMSGVGPPAWTPLNVTDGTDPGSGVFRASGVRSVHWTPPTNWQHGAGALVNGIPGWWIMAEITALAGTMTAPSQQNRDVYSAILPYANVDDAQVPGDIPTLLRFKFHNRSDLDGYETAAYPLVDLDLLENRVIGGLRSLDRGSNFSAYLNCSDEQNPFGVIVTVPASTTIGDDSRTPSGRSAVHDPPARGLTNYDTALTFTLSTAVAYEFYGVYHVYLRAHLYEPSADQGTHDDIRVRLRIRSGSGGVSYVTKYQQFAGWDESGEVFKDWVLLDFGQVNIPATGMLKTDEVPDETSIIIEVAETVGKDLRVTLYDLILIPVDEWAGDFVDNALEDDSGITNGYLLDVDSLAYPKRDIRALVRTADAAEFMRSVYQPITNGPAILQANTDQRLWFLTARGVYQGEDTGGAGAVLTDAFADFIDAGVRPGNFIWNTTDAVWGTVDSVTTLTVSATTLAGGVFAWGVGDEYIIICPHWTSEPWNCHSIQLTGNSRYLSMRGDR